MARGGWRGRQRLRRWRASESANDHIFPGEANAAGVWPCRISDAPDHVRCPLRSCRHAGVSRATAQRDLVGERLDAPLASDNAGRAVSPVDGTHRLHIADAGDCGNDGAPARHVRHLRRDFLPRQPAHG